MLHEAARHAIHSSETLSVSVGTLEAMRQQHLEVAKNKMQKSTGFPDVSVQAHMNGQIRMLQNFFLRSMSNKERLHNEISLVSTSFRPGTLNT